jgi:signal transduction histidine kinase
MVTWDWDLRTGLIRYSDNVPRIVAGDEITKYSTISGVLQSVHPDDRDSLARALERTQAEGCPFECEYRMLMLDHKYHWILGNGKSVFLEGGKPVRVLGVSQDITARKRVEEDLHNRSSQLAQLAAELITVEYHERQQLADLVREQLQQLVVAARIQVHAMAAAETGPKRQQLDILRRTLDDTLQISRSIMKDLTPPAHAQEDCSVAFAWLAKDMLKRHHLVVSVKIGSDFTEMDEVRTMLLFTAARELLQNVLKHAGIRKASLQLQRQNGCVQLKVCDQGKGFNPEKLQTSGEHHGFALFSLRQRAELLGGNLTVVSAAGRGTCVFLSLPFAQSNPRLPPPGRPVRRQSRRFEPTSEESVPIPE